MNVDQVRSMLDQSEQVEAWLESAGLVDPVQGRVDLVAMAESGITLDLMAEFVRQLGQLLPHLGDPDLALSTLRRFLEAANNPLSFGTLIEQDDQVLPVLLRLFSASEAIGDQLVRDPAAFDLLRMTDGQPVARETLLAEICGEVANLTDARDVSATLRMFQRRESLRIAYGDIIEKQVTEIVGRQLSFLADAVCEAAFRFCRRELEQERGIPRLPNGQPARYAVVGLGRWGGQELDYGHRLEALIVVDGSGRTDGDRPMENREFWERLTKRFIDLLSEQTELGVAFQIDLQRSPAAKQDRQTLSYDETLAHFDSRGRTWERQMLIQARPVAGDISWGHAFVDSIEPWIYRRYLTRDDITGIRALKRRLERRQERSNLARDVAGGSIDVEFAVQFLQLINGGDHRELRVGPTVAAIRNLELTGCLTTEEAQALEENYGWLRQIEHRLQVMQTSSATELPATPQERRRLALRCGYPADDSHTADQFRDDFFRRTRENQQIIRHLLRDVLDDETMNAESELVLDPMPSVQQIETVLTPYKFRDCSDAYHQLDALALERIPFLSSRRCRHFLSKIAKPLLEQISQTPSPDATIANLCLVSDSLGGKGVLWELFDAFPSSLELYVRLCAASPYLTSILTRYPGMIDELMDSLMLAKLPSRAELLRALDTLCEKVEDIEPILHSFKNTQHLNVGVRELLGKEDIQDACATLADVAEVCLQRITREQYQKLIRKYGQPRLEGDTKPSELVILAMGKFGGREPNYHSDVDIVVLYEAEGQTYHPPTVRGRETTTNQHFFAELARRIVKYLSDHGRFGPLYDSNPHLRPADPNGPRAVSLATFEEFYLTPGRSLIDFQPLCQSRAVVGSDAVKAKATRMIRQALLRPRVNDLSELRAERLRVQGTAGPRNLKRGPGGTLDVEYIVQGLQLRHGTEHPDILHPGTFPGLQALAQTKLLSAEDADGLVKGYRFLRRVEARLRLLNTSARHDLPRESSELEKLAYLTKASSASSLEAECARICRANRRILDRVLR